MASCRERTRQRGAALMLLLWPLLALSAITVAFAGLTGTEARVAANVANAARARHAADAGVHMALSVLLSAAPRPDADGVERLDGRFEDAVLSIEIRDEGGKVDLNLAPPRLLAAALGAAGLDRTAVEPVVEAILDWRDADGQPGPKGAEAPAYRAAGLLYGPRNSDFRDVDEVGRVLGIDALLLQQLRPFVTVHGRSSGIDPLRAAPVLLRAIPGIDRFAVERLLAAREASGRRPDTAALEGAADLVAPSHRLAHTIDVEARMPSGTRFRRTALVWLTSSRDKPFLILRWREADVANAPKPVLMGGS